MRIRCSPPLTSVLVPRVLLLRTPWRSISASPTSQSSSQSSSSAEYPGISNGKTTPDKRFWNCADTTDGLDVERTVLHQGSRRSPGVVAVAAGRS